MYFFLFGMAMVQGRNKTIGFPSYNNGVKGFIDPRFGIESPWDKLGNNKTPVVGEYRSLMSVTALNPSHEHMFIFIATKLCALGAKECYSIGGNRPVAQQH